MKNNTLETILYLILIVILCSGCSFAGKVCSGKEKCTINKDNITQFEFQGENYAILDEAKCEKDLGSFVGEIKKIVATDKNGKVILEEDTGKASFKSLSQIKKKAPDAAYIVPLLNVYKEKNSKNLLVDAAGSYHLAVKTSEIKNNDKVFDFRISKSEADDFEINPNNCTELKCGEKIYKITDKKLSQRELGEYIDIIGKSVVFNKDTKKEISKDELKKIDVDGNSTSKSPRESWTLGEIRKVSGKEATECVAVEINSQFYLAATK